MKKVRYSTALTVGWGKTFFDYLFVVIGSAIIAIAFCVFLLPNHIASGGVSGISTILKSTMGYNPAFVQWAFNIPLFIAGVIFLGRQFGVKTLVGTIFIPFVVYLITVVYKLEPATDNPLLASIFGGLFIGLGLGIVFRGKASTGGTDLAAQIVHKYTGLSLGICVAFIDGLIVLTSAIVFNLESGMYALIALFVTSKTIDLVQIGLARSKMALIITSEVELVTNAIVHELDRGVTKLTGIGGYTNEDRLVLMCVLDQTEFSSLRDIVKSIDRHAFITVVDATEVLGEGFTNLT
ncbi:YitT family protein [Gottfriedia luciferensis]|uniref:YitT family protein n=1 Tax=Gottfriedia luciferensis TaxID=178774 RepID=UPI000B45265B|nr:YitT family protein [Gottfriedia luciferensis]